ncbi:hypothetical protein [Rhizobium laguerreae]|uniref:hypothetical protein n=1 Tax=Rhizobium laguerreae TaxID=1076926 RepID=UPI001C90C654|nr:hypothetical protein [Rhizobium laguerreae]
MWKTDNPAYQSIEIGGAQHHGNPQLAFAAKAAQDAVFAAGQKPISKLKRRDVQKAAVEVSASTDDDPEVKTVSPVTVELIERPHSMIMGIVLELQNATPDQDGGISLEGIRIHEGSRTRIIALLHNLAHALELRSITIGHGKSGLRAEMLPDVIRFEILEGRKLEKHEPTPSELRKEMDFQRRRDLATRRGQWLLPEHFYPEYDYHYSAKLSFEVHNWADGARKRGGSVCLNSFGRFAKWISASIMPHGPEKVAAGTTGWTMLLLPPTG